MICQFDAVGGREGELDLAGTVLDLHGPRRQSQRREVALDRLEQRLDLVGEVLSQQVPAPVDELVVSGGLVDAVEVEFHLEAGPEPQPAIGQPLVRLSADAARRQLDRSALDAVQVAEQPPGPVEPRQHTERGGVRRHDHVARPHDRGERRAAVRLPDLERVVLAGVLGEQ
ncbi:MAG: hypothetical protein OXH75_13955 [Acidobacteria bacterium]|nr:hypothetical protein [Acidobacteriota bacterium]